MSDPFIAEVRFFSFEFAPEGWAKCDGQTMQIKQNEALFSLIGNYFGGDGTTTFKLPNLNGVAPVGRSKDMILGAYGGEEQHTLTIGELARHQHNVVGSAQAANSVTPATPTSGHFWGSGQWQFSNASKYFTLIQSDWFQTVGGSQPHPNMQPYLVLNACIALEGINPSEDVPTADPFLGEIRIFAGNFAPRDWAMCDGGHLPISKHEALFSILGTSFGYDDQKQEFSLPDLRERAPIHRGQGPGLTERSLGEEGGRDIAFVQTEHMPTHSHTARCTNQAAVSSDPASGVWAKNASTLLYSTTASPGVTMDSTALEPAGGDGSHNNRQPYMALSFIIALSGVYPTPTQSEAEITKEGEAST